MNADRTTATTLPYIWHRHPQVAEDSTNDGLDARLLMRFQEVSGALSSVESVAHVTEVRMPNVVRVDCDDDRAR